MLKKIWEGWKKIAKKIGEFNARVILTIFYFVLLAPLALVVRRSDPMGIWKHKKHGWSEKPAPKGTPKERALQQF
jgi:hypothetical protein